MFCPVFPEWFLEKSYEEIRRKTAPYQYVQRYKLASLLHQHPDWSQDKIGQQVGLSGRQVQRWRKRWSKGDLSVEDIAGRGRKADFSPTRSRRCKSNCLRVGCRD